MDDPTTTGPLGDWECDLFGCQAIFVRPMKGKVPNRFYRFMHKLLTGSTWRQDKPIPVSALPQEPECWSQCDGPAYSEGYRGGLSGNLAGTVH